MAASKSETIEALKGKTNSEIQYHNLFTFLKVTQTLKLKIKLG